MKRIKIIFVGKTLESAGLYFLSVLVPFPNGSHIHKIVSKVCLFVNDSFCNI
jgi:hypothetical protein